jgi:O-antigen/teichoic acid export membrane protein
MTEGTAVELVQAPKGSITRRYQRLRKSDFASKVAQTYLTQLLKILIGVVTSVIVARALGPEGRGVFALAGALAALGIQFGNMGMHASNTYFIAGNPKLLDRLLGNSLTLSFALGIGIAGGTWIVLLIFPEMISVHGWLLAIALISIPIGIAFLLLENLLLGLHEVKAFNAAELINRSLPLVLLLFVITLRPVNVLIAFGTTLIALIAGTVYSYARIRRRLEGSMTVSKTLFAQNFRYGLKAYTASLFCFLVLRVDLFLVQKMLGLEQTGYYSVAATMADMVALLAATIGTILFPRLSAEPVIRRKLDFMWKACAGTAAIMFLLVIVASLLARPVVLLMFGKAFMPSAVAFILLMPGIFFLSIHSVSVQFLNSIGYPKIVVAIWGISLAVNVLANLWLIPHRGINGAAVASSISYFLATVAVLLVIIRRGQSLLQDAVL